MRTDESIRRILCVCTANMCRSPMLQVLLQKACQERDVDVVVESAGVSATGGMPATENAVACMKERKLDLSNHRSRYVLDLDFKQFDLVFCLSPLHGEYMRDKGMPPEAVIVVNADQGGVPDPVDLGLEAYKQCAQLLEDAAAEISESIKGLVPTGKQDEGESDSQSS